MSLNRREMLRLGAVGAGGLCSPSAASSAGPAVDHLPARRRRLIRCAPVAAGADSAPHRRINPELFPEAKAALDSRHSIRRRDFIGIVDFAHGSASRASTSSTCRAAMSKATASPTASGSDPAHSGFLERFSNDFGSYATSNGAYTTGESYHGKYGLSMKIHGLDWTNNNAEARAIVIHNAWYAEPEMIAQHGKLGRSQGCFAFCRETSGT